MAQSGKYIGERTRTAARCRGFTLLELLVALAMIAILAEALYVALSVGFKAQETGTHSMVPVQKLANAFTLMAQDFDGALPPTGVLAGEFTGISTAGSSSSSPSSGSSGSSSGLKSSSGLSASNLNSSTGGLHAESPDGSAVVLLSFYSSANSPLDGEIGVDIRKVEFSLEPPEGDTKPALVRRVYTNLMPSKAPEPRVQVLARDVAHVSLSYFDGTLPRDEWDSKAEGDILPMAVEVTLAINVPGLRDGEESVYQMKRVFALPCGVNAAQAAAATAATSTSGSGTGGGAGGGGG